MVSSGACCRISMSAHTPPSHIARSSRAMLRDIAPTFRPYHSLRLDRMHAFTAAELLVNFRPSWFSRLCEGIPLFRAVNAPIATYFRTGALTRRKLQPDGIDKKVTKGARTRTFSIHLYNGKFRGTASFLESAPQQDGLCSVF